ncbi:scavenger receptor cysteine-rich domain-containing protein DMBT1-like [Branchiostoma floridae x Branchiostoma belcheri]
MYQCHYGRCILPRWECNGYDDCHDGSDELPLNSNCFLNARLVGGKASNEGRLEVQRESGEWGTVCYDLWDIKDADVVCRQLGYTGAVPGTEYRFFGEGKGKIWLDDVFCTGAESNLGECKHNGWGKHNCRHGKDVGVVCAVTDHCEGHRCENNAICNNKDDGYTCICTEGWEGEYCQNKIDHCEGHRCQNNATCNNKDDGYTCICSKGWSGEYCQNARSTCGQDMYQCHNGRCIFRDWECNGYDDCSDGSDELPLNSNCFLNARLVGGKASNEGRLEVQRESGEWGAVCDDSWDIIDADIACRQLGYTGAVNGTEHSFFGAGSGKIWLDNVICTGTESNLAECQHNGWGKHNCRQDEAVGVVCSDHCEGHRCQNNAICHNKDDGYTCICTEGWEGEYCQNKIDHCEGHRCQNNATCNNKDDGYTCICSKGWSGEYCQNDRCEGHLCQNNATCRSNEDGYTCICPNSWRGKYCERKRALRGQQRRKRYGLGSLLSVHIQAKTDTSETGGTIPVTGNFTQWRDITETGFGLQNGQLKIKEAGRYFIYSQVYFGKELKHDHNAVAKYSIKKGRHLLLTCERPLTGVPPPLTCYTAGVLDLKRDDTLVIYVHTTGSPATIDTAQDATFWGAIKLSMDIPIEKRSRKRNRKGKT